MGKNFFLSCKSELPVPAAFPDPRISFARVLAPQTAEAAIGSGGQASAAAGDGDGGAAGPIKSAQPARAWASRVLGLGPRQGNRASSRLNSTASWLKHRLITGSPKV